MAGLHRLPLRAEAIFRGDLPIAAKILLKIDSQAGRTKTFCIPENDQQPV
jgi:hypothetical protein